MDFGALIDATNAARRETPLVVEVDGETFEVVGVEVVNEEVEDEDGNSSTSISHVLLTVEKSE